MHLTVAGDGTILSDLKELATSLNLSQSQVNFIGDIRGERKAHVFNENHIYCFPSSYGEGLPNSVLEALAFGLPVLTRPVGGLPDIFKDGKMGYLVEGKSPEEIADCLEKMIGNREKMVNMGINNAKYAKEHFMASIVAERLQKIYADVIGG